MGILPEVSQRDLRLRSKEIMDSVEAGQSFTITRDGRQIGELTPLRKKRTFVPREEFAGLSRNAPSIDLESLRADQDKLMDGTPRDPYDR